MAECIEKLEQLVGVHHLTGVEMLVVTEKNGWGYAEDVNAVRFVLDGVVYQATEDPDDGYRSMLGTIGVIEGTTVKYMFPPVKVCCAMSDEVNEEILHFTDMDNGEIILKIGTDCSDDWYPWCVMEWTPENMACNQKTERRGRRSLQREVTDMERSKAYHILGKMWEDATPEQAEAINIAQSGLEFLDLMPEDMVRVVFCSECKKYGDDEECPLLSMMEYTEPTDFCSYGEGRGDK